MKKYNPTINYKDNISRRQFIRAAGLTAGAALMGGNICNAKVYKGKTRKFSTGSDCNVTFFAVADTHYGRYQTPLNNERVNKSTIDKMNYIPGSLAYPPEPDGGIVAEPRGVLVVGDVVDSGTIAQWEGFDTVDGFEDDYCGSGTTPARLNWPVYEAFGNHEVQGLNASSNYARDQIRDRTLAGKRPAGANISANGYHYSWDWDTVHFVNLNLYPSAGIDAQDSFGFLVSDLANNVGDSGRPVVLYHHYDFIMTQWWQAGEQDAYYNAIKDYNIIAIIHGHRHITSFESSTWRGINTFDVGLCGTDKFAVFRITKNRLFAAECVTETSWGTIYIKTITT